MLSWEQRVDYCDIGFMKFEGVLPEALVRLAREALIHDCTDPTPPFKLSGTGAVSKLYGLYELGGVYRDIIMFPGILSLLQSLIGDNIVFTRNRHNQGSLNRKGDSAPRLHRDVLDLGHTSVIVYLDDSTIKRGATMLIPKSHRWPYVAEKDGAMWLDSDSAHPCAALCGQSVPVPVNAGGILVFNSAVYHSVGPNTTDDTRASMVLGYHPVNELTGVVRKVQVLALGKNLYRGNTAMERPMAP